MTATYATNLEFAERSGVGLRIVDENVGTGDSSETSFDLDHGNVISESYVLSYAASGSNSFTALTETTHYTLDKESGRILLTTDGKTALSTNILYATYWYTDNFNDDVITDYLAVAQDEINLITGRRWDTATSTTEYKDGRELSGYPTTDEPYMRDWDEPNFLVLDNVSISKIDYVYFLSKPMAIAKFFNYDAGTTTYTDKTDNVNSGTQAPFTLFDDAPAANDYIYIGSEYTFLGVTVNLSTLGTGTPAIDWEYYNGTSWADITETDTVTGASTFAASGAFTWVYPFGWAKNSVNSVSNYWIRGKLTSGYTVDPICATMTINDSVQQYVEPRDYVYSTNGVLTFTNSEIPNGTRNVRIDYDYGQATTPSYITELTVLYASVKAYVNLSGGSYDDATVYTLGSKSISIGEVYVNIREVITQFKTRIKEILDEVGRRGDVVSLQ